MQINTFHPRCIESETGWWSSAICVLTSPPVDPEIAKLQDPLAWSLLNQTILGGSSASVTARSATEMQKSQVPALWKQNLHF